MPKTIEELMEEIVPEPIEEQTAEDTQIYTILAFSESPDPETAPPETFVVRGKADLIAEVREVCKIYRNDMYLYIIRGDIGKIYRNDSNLLVQFPLNGTDEVDEVNIPLLRTDFVEAKNGWIGDQDYPEDSE
jgi:hypothetical protein